MACSQNSLTCLELGYVPSPENIARIRAARRRSLRLSLQERSWASIFSLEVPVFAVLAVILAISFLVRPDSTLRLVALPNIVLPQVPLCPLFELTGLPCLFCGATRAFMAMGGMDIRGSFLFHPLGPAMFLLTVAAALYLMPAIAFRRRLTVSMSPRMKKIAIASVSALILLAWPLKIYIWHRTGLLA